MNAAGIMFTTGTSVLLLKRTDNGNYWAFPAGKIEEGESPEQAAIRESGEETGHIPAAGMDSINTTDKGGVNFTTFLNRVDDEFDVTLNEEHSEHVWAKFDDLPSPLHHGIEATIEKYKAREKQNASQFPKFYYARHMQPGICKYEDEVVLVDTDALKKMIATGAGKPVFIHHGKVDLDTVKEKAAGWITESFYNELDGWAWFKIMVTDDEAHNVISNGWSCSNAYRGTSFAVGGTKNNCPYDREFLDAYFTHLALVPNPRYENADVMDPEQFKAYQDGKRRELEELQNSKPTMEGKPMSIKNLFKRTDTLDADTLVQQGDKLIPALEAIEKLNSSSKKNGAMDVETVDGQMVNAGGEDMTVAELKNRYNAMCEEKKNADDEAKKKADEEKSNAEEEEKKKKDEEEKQNALKKSEEEGNKHYEEMLNANKTTLKETPVVIQSSQAALARGKSLFK